MTAIARIVTRNVETGTVTSKDAYTEDAIARNLATAGLGIEVTVERY